MPHALPERTLRALLRRYGAGDPLCCEPLSQGLLNDGYRVVTTRGRFFLKHHLDKPHLDGDPAAPAGLARIERQHRATARLGALGIPVVPPVPDPEGRTVTVLNGRCYALHPWLEGRHRYGSELAAGECRQLGALLGQVHTRLTQVIPPLPAPPPSSADPAATEVLIDELLDRLRARRARACYDAFDTLAEHRLLERRVLLRRYAAFRPPAALAPSAGWVHGDFHPLNLLYPVTAPGRAPLAILDWDRLAVLPRAEETVRGAAIFFVRADGTLDLPRVRCFARAYRRTASVGAEELSAAVHRVWWERLNDFWMLRWRYQLGDRRTDGQFPATAALAVWWCREYEAVRSAFCD
ncbi:aminoglycoside phosphotransferase [Streptomyces sp. AJS327]|nr:aminoglycoside phosphotransferase [Streptomyces sp. AJS327]